MDEVVIPLGENQKRVVLKEHELLLLKELSIHRVMRSPEVHAFLQTAYGKEKNRKVLSNRLSRLVQTNVLIRIKEKKKGWGIILHRYYYKLGKNGIKALVKTGLLSESNSFLLYQHVRRTGLPSEHDVTASKLANRVAIKRFNNKMLNFEHYPGSRHEFLISKPIKKGVVADWVFKGRSRTVFLEVDSGSQRLNVIQTKVERYFDSLKGQKGEFYIIFSVIDGFADDEYDDRSRRITSLKEGMPPCHQWPDNISIYVMTASRTPDLISRLLAYEEPMSTDEKVRASKYWIEQWNEVDPNAVTYLNKSDLYNYDFNNSLEVDVVVRDNIQKNRVYGILFVEEGSVVGYQKLRANCKKKYTKMTDLIVIYLNEEQASEDVYGSMWGKLWITDIHTWETSVANPKVFKLRSPYRKEKVYFE